MTSMAVWATDAKCSSRAASSRYHAACWRSRSCSASATCSSRGCRRTTGASPPCPTPAGARCGTGCGPTQGFWWPASS
eukprot:4827387-Alexandrium_andersonii.AAC.1